MVWMKAYLLGLVVVATALTATASSQPLTIGDRAPAIRVDSWIKGEPIKTIEPDKVYVFLFWSTNNPYETCYAHVTELARKYAGNAVFAGFDVSEQGRDIPTKVKAFVDQMGDKMGFAIALDDMSRNPTGWFDGTNLAAGTMDQSWLRAAAAPHLPTAFIIKDAKIQWFDWIIDATPLDEPLAQIVSGTYDAEAGRLALAKKAEARNRQMRANAEADAPFREAERLYEIGKTTEALKILDAMDGDSSRIREALRLKLVLTLPYDPKTADKVVDQVVKSGSSWATYVLIFATQTRIPGDPDVRPVFDKVVAKAMREAARLSKCKDPNVLYWAAFGSKKIGDRKTALDYARKALKAFPGSKWESDQAYVKFVTDFAAELSK